MNKDYQFNQFFMNEKQFEILSDSKKLATQIKLDVLDVKKSWSRQSTDKTYDEILNILNDSKRQHWSFMMRSNHKKDEQFYYEVSVCNLDTPSYFIWINISVEDGTKLINKYELKNKFENL